ncbi:molybdopterin-binding protein [Planktotalea sp.]|uniref:molybdopterin-binding protein n=1 Tax=Planktotalea sp. TaxID=2029877 RepID=UPI0032971721
MKFGPRPIDQAHGCILAHSIALPTGRLRKGITLTDKHICDLKAEGRTEITVAALETGDVEEDTAATRLGAALLDSTTGLRASVAATGRVNLIATGAGVALIDEAKLHALNDVNPMISFASVPAFHQMHENGMVGTVKIISYAVPEGDLNAACTLARGAVKFAPAIPQRVSLIISQINDGADEDKAIAATRARVEALECELSETLICQHSEQAIAEAIAQARGDVVLILTGSATSDPFDVAPSAVVQAGGVITRFGMPVDPGNLLFLGHLGNRPIIGLPGCARSPALNGADKVLSRVLCGVPVSSADIAKMGVGGLLKEIPTRPRPRAS